MKTSFQDDFAAEVERQSKEAEGIPQTAFNRPSPIEETFHWDGQQISREQFEKLRSLGITTAEPSPTQIAPAMAIIARLREDMQSSPVNDITVITRSQLETLEAAVICTCADQADIEKLRALLKSIDTAATSTIALLQSNGEDK